MKTKLQRVEVKMRLSSDDVFALRCIFGELATDNESEGQAIAKKIMRAVRRAEQSLGSINIDSP
jgi:hypothetical protein